MGVYNPNIPQILGQEWVPIRGTDVVFSPSVNAVELGHSFTLATSRTLQDGRFYIKEPPPGATAQQVYMINIYPKGAEALSGPVRSVLIPCNSAATTGSGFTTVGGDIPTALESPGDGLYVMVTPNTNTSQKSLNLFFATNGYSQLLMGKRILGVNFVYQLSWENVESGVAGSIASRNLVYTTSQSLTLETGTGSTADYDYAPLVGTFGSNLLALDPPVGNLGNVQAVQRIELGEINRFWSSPSAQFFGEQLPWRYQELQRFEASSGTNRYRIHFDFGGITEWAGNFYLGYAALEVLYCEETRVAYGGRNFFASSISLYENGANLITMRDTSFNASPALSAGEYTVTVSSPDIGDVVGSGTIVATDISRKAEANSYPKLNAVQQLFAISSHKGLQLDLTQTVDETFSAEETNILPQITLHLSTGPLNEVHVYGDQVRAQVYGTITATQDILDGPATGAASYPWVRFYARRFGGTTVPLTLDSPTIAGSSVSITPDEFDVLDEIVDGWKEVTLRFDTPPSMGTGTNPQWRWSATGELAGNRWEVMGAIAPAISGLPGNLLNTVPSPQQLSLATYGAPVSGANINLGWIPGYSPLVSATTDDPSSDAALIFAQDLPVITGFSTSLQEQELTGIGLDCGLDPCCVPSALDYVEVSWGLPANTGVASDTWTRTESGTWGTPDVGPAYGYSGVQADFSADGERGLITFSFTGGSNYATLATGSVNFDQTVQTTFDSLPSSSVIAAGILGRFSSTSNTYIAQARVSTTGALSLRLTEFVGGVEATLGEYTLTGLIGAGTTVNIRFAGYGAFLKAKLWKGSLDDEPSTWGIEVTDTSLTTGSSVGLLATNSTAVTGVVVEFDNYTIGPPQPWFGYYELQRMDTVTTTWQTIMKATTPSLTGFNDYEARVGIESSYRIRAVDVYDFPGQWSSTVTATVPAPGVTIECDEGHLLIFTSNEEQDGSVNLAYSSVWEQGRTVEEGFVFPESQFVQLQAMYNRDFFTAFRPTERGGEQFSRTVLVQAAAIDPETLADFTSLRDMAWADTSYICVRDEDGNRWFATVLVPSGRVLRDRRLYLAPVDIIEVTDTPSEVDP
jgi:hypothetical protein